MAHHRCGIWDWDISLSKVVGIMKRWPETLSGKWLSVLNILYDHGATTQQVIIPLALSSSAQGLRAADSPSLVSACFAALVLHNLSCVALIPSSFFAIFHLLSCSPRSLVLRYSLPDSLLSSVVNLPPRQRCHFSLVWLLTEAAQL